MGTTGAYQRPPQYALDMCAMLFTQVVCTFDLTGAPLFGRAFFSLNNLEVNIRHLDSWHLDSWHLDSWHLDSWHQDGQQPSDSIDLIATGLLSSIASCSHLTSLTLTNASVPEPHQQRAAAVLASLPSLKSLELASLNYNRHWYLAAHLTALTSLGGTFYDTGDVLPVITRNPRLQHLYLDLECSLKPGAAYLRSILSACPSLAEVSLRGLTIDQQALDVLLTLGTHITTLKHCTFKLRASRAHWQGCSWRCLDLKSLDIWSLAYLPLRTVQTNARDSFHDCPHLTLPLEVPAEEVLGLLRQAAINLGAGMCLLGRGWGAQIRQHTWYVQRFMGVGVVPCDRLDAPVMSCNSATAGLLMPTGVPEVRCPCMLAGCPAWQQQSWRALAIRDNSVYLSGQVGLQQHLQPSAASGHL
jgi:hypothetical protein